LSGARCRAAHQQLRVDPRPFWRSRDCSEEVLAVFKERFGCSSGSQDARSCSDAFCFAENARLVGKPVFFDSEIRKGLLYDIPWVGDYTRKTLFDTPPPSLVARNPVR